MRGTPPKFQNSHTFAPLEFVGQLSIFPYVGYKHHVQQLTVLKKLGHTMYDPATIDAELAVQSGVNSIEPASRRVFRDFVVNVPQFRVYLAMLGGQQHVSIIHIPGVYYSIASAAPTFGCPDS